MLRQMSDDLTLGEAAKALGVSADTLRRWDRAGRLHTHRDDRNRRRSPASEVERLREPPATATGPSTRSRRATASPGIVRSVEVDGVMALVEIEAGPHRITAAVTRDSVEELGLAPGVPRDRRRQGDLRAAGPHVRRRAAARAARAAAPLAAGCGDDDEQAAGAQLTVSAAASLQAALTACAGDATRLQFAGSDELAAQIRQGAPVDVLAAANTSDPGRARRRGQARGARRASPPTSSCSPSPPTATSRASTSSRATA